MGAWAQGTVKGVLFDENNGEAVPFANVILDGTAYGCATDLNGFFLDRSLSSAKADGYVIRNNGTLTITNTGKSSARTNSCNKEIN